MTVPFFSPATLVTVNDAHTPQADRDGERPHTKKRVKNYNIVDVRWKFRKKGSPSRPNANRCENPSDSTFRSRNVCAFFNVVVKLSNERIRRTYAKLSVCF